MSEIPPSQTLYLQNLPYKVNINELRSSLYGLFSTYGPILDIVTKKSNKMREQAFIVYDNVASATAAMRSLNGFNFYNNPLKIQYSKTKSHAVAKLDGTFRLQTVEERKKAANNVNAVGKRSQDGQESEQASKRARNEEESESEEDED